MSERTLSFSLGCKDGLPIFVGYFPTAMAFGLVVKELGLRLWEAVLFSMSNFAGSGQFLAASLIGSNALLVEIFISVLLINLRYTFMGAEVARRLEGGVTGIRRALLAHGTTDEVFSIALMNPDILPAKYLGGLELVSYLGWVSGTALGFLIGLILPPALQLAVGVTIYAMFSSLLAQEFRQKGAMVLLIAGISAASHSVLTLVLDVKIGWSFVISMLFASFIGSLIIREDV